MVQSVTTFPAQAITDAQYQINCILNQYIEGGNRNNRQKQGYFYGAERWRDLKIVLQNKFVKVKSGLLAQLSEEIVKPIYSIIMIITIVIGRDVITRLI